MANVQEARPHVRMSFLNNGFWQNAANVDRNSWTVIKKTGKLAVRCHGCRVLFVWKGLMSLIKRDFDIKDINGQSISDVLNLIFDLFCYK